MTRYLFTVAAICGVFLTAGPPVAAASAECAGMQQPGRLQCEQSRLADAQTAVAEEQRSKLARERWTWWAVPGVGLLTAIVALVGYRHTKRNDQKTRADELFARAVALVAETEPARKAAGVALLMDFCIQRKDRHASYAFTLLHGVYHDLVRDSKQRKSATTDLVQKGLSRVLIKAGKDLELKGAYAAQTELRGGDFANASMQFIWLVDADLRDADLRKCRLGGAKLDGANFSGARLQGAKLNGASAKGAKFFHARMNGADLAGARLDDAALLSLPKGAEAGRHVVLDRKQRQRLATLRAPGA